MTGPSAIEAVLEALDGIAYWTDPDGVIRGGASRNWNAFASANGAPHLALNSVIGRNIFDIIEGDEVRAVYRDLHALVVKDLRPRVTFSFRCDGPAVHRLMRMTLGAIALDQSLTGVLYHAQIIDQRERPPLDLLAFGDAARQAMNDDAPIVAICSFCQAVQQPGADKVWGTPEDYYRAGGQSVVRLSHGVCPACTTEMAGL